MSKLDELDKCNGNPNCPRAKIGHLGEICKEVICICNTNARKYYEAGRIEEREALKKVVEGKMKLKGMHYANGYNTALSDILNELNKN